VNQHSVISRRDFLRLSGALAGGSVLAQAGGCSASAGAAESTALRYWSQRRKGEFSDFEYLVMCATLAANPHNTQPWRFQLFSDRIEVYADRDRNLGAADSERRMLQMALGCAVENMTVAATQLGYRNRVELDAGQRFAVDGHCATVWLTPGFPRRHPWFEAIFQRQTTRSPYSPEPVAASFQRDVDRHCNFPGIALRWYRSPEQGLAVADLVRRSARTFVADAASYRDGMEWFRLTHEEWERRGDGIAIFTSNAPWYVKQYVEWFSDRQDLEGAMFQDGVLAHVNDVRSATPLWCLVYSERPDPNTRMQGGRMVEQIYLEAASQGLAVQPLCYPTEVPAMAMESRRVFGVSASAEPLLLLRIGRATLLEKSVRREIREVIV
jgi:hypothetical protein